MFTGDVKVCDQSDFSFDTFNNLINEYKNATHLTLYKLSGDGGILTYIFDTLEDDRVWLEFDSNQVCLSIEIRSMCSLEKFNTLYKELKNQVRYCI